MPSPPPSSSPSSPSLSRAGGMNLSGFDTVRSDLPPPDDDDFRETRRSCENGNARGGREKGRRVVGDIIPRPIFATDDDDDDARGKNKGGGGGQGARRARVNVAKRTNDDNTLIVSTEIRRSRCNKAAGSEIGPAGPRALSRASIDTGGRSEREEEGTRARAFHIDEVRSRRRRSCPSHFGDRAALGGGRPGSFGSIWERAPRGGGGAQRDDQMARSLS